MSGGQFCGSRKFPFLCCLPNGRNSGHFWPATDIKVPDTTFDPIIIDELAHTTSVLNFAVPSFIQSILRGM